MTRSLPVALCAALSCFSVSAAFADTSVTITATSSECKVSPPAEMTSNSPSIPAGVAAIRNRNYALARANFKPLAEKGDAEGQRSYGRLLMMKCTGLQDQAAGAEWFQKAADAGDAEAAAELGSAYMNGEGVTQDDGKAFALVSKAANAGLGGAQANLGYLYLSGRGVERDPYQGMAWSVKAGEQGVPVALFNIAQAYQRGGALPQDLDEAAYFLQIALQRSTPQQKQNSAMTINTVTRAVSGRDMGRAADRARRWAPGAGSLAGVLRDAARRRDQAAKG